MDARPVAGRGPADAVIGGEALEACARATLSSDVFDYFAGGSGQGETLLEQRPAWQRVWLRPRILTDVSTVETATSVLGLPVTSPLLVAPTALHGLAHADGEIATAEGAQRAGCNYIVSMRASRRLEDIAAAAGAFWQQIYVLRDRAVSDDIALRAAELGASAIVVTVDTPHVARKAAAIPATPLGRGLVAALDDRDLSDSRLQQAPDVTPQDLARLRDITGLPVVAKGVLRGDQARRCVEAGAAAVVVSTHGGRQLDGVVPVPHALPEVVDEVGDSAEVYADGGVRTGVDVLRALALGARAVLIGRPVLWALAVGGASAVADHLSDLRLELRDALALAGCTGPGDVSRDMAWLR